MCFTTTEIESYIRPGCIILTMYLHLEKSTWDEVCFCSDARLLTQCHVQQFLIFLITIDIHSSVVIWDPICEGYLMSPSTLSGKQDGYIQGCGIVWHLCTMVCSLSLCVCVCVWNLYIHACVYMCTRTRAHTYIYTCMYIWIKYIQFDFFFVFFCHYVFQTDSGHALFISHQ